MDGLHSGFVSLTLLLLAGGPLLAAPVVEADRTASGGENVAARPEQVESDRHEEGAAGSTRAELEGRWHAAHNRAALLSPAPAATGAPRWLEPRTAQVPPDADGGPANGATEALPEVNVTAVRRPKPTFRTVESVSVITRGDISALTPLAQNVTGLLRVIPGVQLGSGTSPLEANVSIRGLGDDRSPVFIDGERQNVSQGELREDLFSLDPRDIERIEVLRGSASATYGTDVTGGLINIITRQPEANTPLRPEFETFWGGPSTWRTGARLTFGGDTYALRLGATQTATGDARNAFGGVIPNQQDYQNYQARLDLLPNADNRIALKYSGFRFHSGLLAISELPETEAGLPFVSKDRFGIDWRSRRIFGSATDFKLGVYYNQVLQTFQQRVVDEEDGELEFDNRSTIRANTIGSNLQLNTPVGSGFLTYGVDFYHEEGFNATLTLAGDEQTTFSNLPVTPDGRQTGIGGYLFIDYPILANLQVTAGLRYDSYTTEGYATPAFAGADSSFAGLVRNDSAVTPKAGLSWNFAPGLRVRANYSQGFRVPTVKERFFRGFAGPLNAEIEDLDLGGGAVPPFISLRGNPNLTTERTDSFEVGFGGASPGASWDVVYFHNQVSGLLRAVFEEEEDGVPEFRFENLQNVTIQGVEVQGVVDLTPEWRLRGAFTWTDAVDAETNRQLGSVVPTFGVLQARYRAPEGFFALLQLRAASERIGAGSYLVGDFNAGVPIGVGLQLTLTASNLFNSFYRESLVGFYAPGTQFFVGLRTDLGAER